MLNQPPPPPTVRSAPRIGVFDSGLGGLSVLRALLKVLPQGRFEYVADSAWAPYGERSDAEILARSEHIAGFLMNDRQCDLIVVACNSATAAAINRLRSAHPPWDIVGVEPGIKPAVAMSASGRIGVMATDATLRSERMQKLLQQHASSVTVLTRACTGLAREIENGDLNSPQVMDLIERHCQPLSVGQVDTVVLGCTHYVFVEGLIQSAMGPKVKILDTADAVARQVERRLSLPLATQATAHVLTTSTDPSSAPMTPMAPIAAMAHPQVRLWSSGDPERLRTVCQAWGLGDHPAAALPA